MIRSPRSSVSATTQIGTEAVDSPSVSSLLRLDRQKNSGFHQLMKKVNAHLHLYNCSSRVFKDLVNQNDHSIRSLVPVNETRCLIRENSLHVVHLVSVVGLIGYRLERVNAHVGETGQRLEDVRQSHL